MDQNIELVSSSADSYQWFLNGVAITGATNQTFTARAAGSYTVRATINGCSAESAATDVTVENSPLCNVSDIARAIIEKYCNIL